MLYTLVVAGNLRLGLLLLLDTAVGACVQLAITAAVVVLLLREANPTDMTATAAHLDGEQNNQSLLGTLMHYTIVLATSIVVSRTSSKCVLGKNWCVVWPSLLVLIFLLV